MLVYVYNFFEETPLLFEILQSFIGKTLSMALLCSRCLINRIKQFSVLAARQGRCFTSFENKLSLFDIFANEEDVDRNGLVLPSVNSIVSYTSQRQYRVGKYIGIKLIDGIQKLQILNEHDCIRDVVIIASAHD